ncbi:hypothetical protein NC661_20235 [Aquibacillus koreensis]|uniref:Uncharacterized protein n=1 Tax=Aquibacillus koreensis TaxID=279446 RepID=A0A9X3WPE7_9BACI|nr:hypothetical protein [Aquibacillus koreensis]MCT2535502.1 hypothetical protein [Aquibacillus koreensis]MDC3422685.1 hypothetical protein [Aquibacillus koreensis]
MHGYEKINAEVKVMKVKMEENAKEIEELQDQLDHKIGKHEGLVLIEKTIGDKRFMTEEEANALVNKIENKMESYNNQIQLQLIKWIIGVGISVAGITIGALRLFIG